MWMFDPVRFKSINSGDEFSHELKNLSGCALHEIGIVHESSIVFQDRKSTRLNSSHVD